MEKISNLFIFLLIIVLFLPGCASIVSESYYPVNISSTPFGADVSIKNRRGRVIFYGITPTTVSLKTSTQYLIRENYTVTFKKKGYSIRTIQIIPGIDYWYFGNIIFGGLIGILIVDPLTGAMWSLDNLNINLDLTNN